MSELGPEARAILEEGKRGDDPSPEDRARLRRAVMAAIATGGAGAAASLAGEGAAQAAERTLEIAGTAKAAGLAWKLLLGLAVMGAVGGGLMLQQATPARPAPSPPPPLEARAENPAAMPAAAEPAPPVPSEPSASANAMASPAPRRSAATTRAPAAAEDPLEAEMRRLREVHDALNGGDPARAIALLDAQAVEFADGQLHEEREAARVLSLCKLGRSEGTSAAAARFLEKNPRSPLADRVRAACALTR